MHNLPLNIVIPLEKDKDRLDQVLAYLLPQYSRTYLQKQIKNKCVFVASQCITKANTLVFAGQTVELRAAIEPSCTDWQSDQSIALTIIYEDEALLVVDKAAGIVTHPAPGHTDKTLVNALLHHAPYLKKLPRSGIIHRLDKDTSGLLVVPKTLLVYNDLIKKLAERKITRIYHAIVKGHFTAGGMINAPIGRHWKFRQKQAITLKGKPAITHYRLLERFLHHTLLEVTLETGRTHQIRVHMAHVQRPILGDTTYGRSSVKIDPTFPRQALHAKKLGLEHPLTHQFCEWESPLPSDMNHLLKTLRENH